MSKLLLNGCSFTRCWNPSDKFVKEMGCDVIVNLGKDGGGMSRVVRSTIEWIAQNDAPNFIIIPIPLYSRWELSISNVEDIVDGTWYPMQIKQYIEKKNISNLIDFDKLEKLVELYYGSIPDIRTYWDRCFTDIISLSCFLEQNKINYIMFDMCNDFSMHHLAGYKGFEKINFIKENKKIIDLFNFCGNRFMWNCIDRENKKEIDPLMHHHADKEYHQLEKYLLDYHTLHF